MHGLKAVVLIVLTIRVVPASAFNLRRQAAVQLNISQQTQALHLQAAETGNTGRVCLQTGSTSHRKDCTLPPRCPADVSETGPYMTEQEIPDVTHTVCRYREGGCNRPGSNLERLNSIRGLLKRTKKLLNDHEVPYALYSGSAIGQERCEDVLPWDTDCDVAVWMDHVHKIPEGDLDSQYTVMHTSEFRNSPHHGAGGPSFVPYVVVDKRSGLYCDIFFMNWNPGDRVVGMAWPGGNNICLDFNSTYPFSPEMIKRCNLFPLENIHPFVPCVMDGVEHKCFQNQAAYLRQEYGPGWNQPVVKTQPSAGKKSVATLNSVPVDTTSFSSTAAVRHRHSVCNASLQGYDDDKCFEYALGRTQVQFKAMLHESRNSTRQSSEVIRLGNSTAIGASSNQSKMKSQSCSRRFYTWSFDDFESTFGGFNLCYISTYAMIVQLTALQFPCQAASPEEADVLMVPPYSARECNWPAYGGGDCRRSANQYRPGLFCHTEVASVAKTLQSRYPGKRILLVDQQPREPYNLPKADYGAEGLIWAKVNSMKPAYRPDVDISMPPAAVERCKDTPDSAYNEPVTAKRWFISFKGALHPATAYSAIREDVQSLFHNDKDQIVVDSSDYKYDFDELLQKSRFNLILGGDVEFSYRFNEAVCSGGVPVLVTDRWIPPFNEFLPFETYGVLVRESNIANLMAILRALPDQEVELRRRNARAYCQKAFMSVEASVWALLNHIVGPKFDAYA